MFVVASLGAFVSVWLALANPDARDRLRPALGPSARLAGLVGRLPYGLGLGAAVVTAAVAGVLFGVTVGILACTMIWLVRVHRRRVLTGRRQAEVVDACRALAALLRVGHVPTTALRTVVQDAPVLTEVVAVQRVGGDVAPVLRRLAAAPGRHGLSELANAWEVSERTGASLTATLDALAARLVAQEGVRQIVQAELSAPRSTGRLLAALPVAGLALGFFMGGDPLGFLGGSVVGQIVLVAGAALACAGIVWTERIADGNG